MLHIWLKFSEVLLLILCPWISYSLIITLAKKGMKTKTENNHHLLWALLSDSFIFSSGWLSDNKRLGSTSKEDVTQQKRNYSLSSSKFTVLVLFRKSWLSLSCKIITPEPCGHLTNHSVFSHTFIRHSLMYYQRDLSFFLNVTNTNVAVFLPKTYWTHKF